MSVSALASILASRQFPIAECTKRLAALSRDRDEHPPVRALIAAHGEKAEQVAYAYVEALPWAQLFDGEVMTSSLAALLLGVVEWGQGRPPAPVLAVQIPDLLAVVRSIAYKDRGELGALAARIARFAQRGDAADREWLVQRVRGSDVDLANWYCDYDVRSGEQVHARLFDLLAARFDSVEQKLDWIIPRGYGHTRSMYVAACVLARELGGPQPNLTIQQQVLGAFTLTAILRVARAYDPTLLGKYEKCLRMPMRMTKGEKQALFDEFAAEMKQHKLARAAAEKAAARASARGQPKVAPPTPSGSMPRYNRDVDAALLVFGRFTTGWIKAAAFETIEQKVRDARDSFGLPLVCVPCGELPKANAKRKFPDMVADGSVGIVIGLELGRADKKTKTSGAIKPAEIAGAKQALKKLSAAFWTETGDVLGKQLSKQQFTIVIAAGVPTASLLSGDKAVAVAEHDNGGLMTAGELPASSDLFVVARA